MDRRQQKTRKAILDAFGRLLSEKSFSQITVQHIIDEANIGRTTFYAHFDTKDALFEEMCVDLFNHVFSDSLQSEEMHDFSLGRKDARKVIAHILHHLLESEKSIKGVLSGENGEIFFHYFKQYSDELIPKALFGDADFRATGASEEFLAYHISTSFISTVQWWVRNKFDQSPETVADYYLSVIEPLVC